MHSSLDKLIAISPASWPRKRLVLQPGDFSAILPAGTGMVASIPIREWDDQFDRKTDTYYGFQKRVGDPFQDAPLSSAAGGVI